MKDVLILGGAGFIGSQIAEIFHKSTNVTIIDGLIQKTGGNIQNISHLRGLTFIDKCIENVPNLSNIVSKQDLIIDCMGWTSHLGAIIDPLFDLKINLSSHICLLESLKDNLKKNCIVVYLGSTSQYGSTPKRSVDEATRMFPSDVHGINKLCAENYFRIYSYLYNINVVSLRIPNCYGENQPYIHEDIGLIGGFIKSGLLTRKIVVYENYRKRNFIYVKDLANIVYKITRKKNISFESYNVPSINMRIIEIAELISSFIKGCKVIIKEIPENIQKLDGNDYILDCSKIIDKISYYKMSNVKETLKISTQYFREKFYDFQK